MNSQAELTETKKSARFRVGFYVHLTAYLAVNALLVSINLLTTPARLWFTWPLLGWGVGLLAHGLAVFALPVLISKSGRAARGQ